MVQRGDTLFALNHKAGASPLTFTTTKSPIMPPPHLAALVWILCQYPSLLERNKESHWTLRIPDRGICFTFSSPEFKVGH